MATAAALSIIGPADKPSSTAAPFSSEPRQAEESQKSPIAEDLPFQAQHDGENQPRSDGSETSSLRTSTAAQSAVTGTQTPDPLLVDRDASNTLQGSTNNELERRITASKPTYPLHIQEPTTVDDVVGVAEEAGSPVTPITQGIPPELANFTAEIIFILTCSIGQLLFAMLMGDVVVNQLQFVKALGVPTSQNPWLIGAYLLANGLSVILSGSLADLVPPKGMMVGAFLWLTVWDIAGAFSISPSTKYLFFVVRAMQGLAIGVLVSASMSILGRIYKPGRRKTRVFSFMSAMSPLGFWTGTMQGGALSAHLPWIFGSNAILCGMCSIAAFLTIPSLRPAKDSATSDPPSLRNFDYFGALLAVLGSGCLLFGLTQGSSSQWNPYTYSLIIVGILSLVGFYFAEKRADRPLIPNKLWTSPGFTPLVISYFLGFGAYIGAWQFYAIQFWLRIQHATPLQVALYIIPNAVVGLLATWIVSRTLHLFSTHWILTAAMLAYALGPVFFLPQTAGTSYWALSMPGIALVTFGPDLSFAAASIFITSSVARSYQGSAGSLLVTVQNLSAAIITAVADTIGVQVDRQPDDTVGLKGLRAIWWFGFALSLAAALITATSVRIAKTEEKEHTR